MQTMIAIAIAMTMIMTMTMQEKQDKKTLLKICTYPLFNGSRTLTIYKPLITFL